MTVTNEQIKAVADDVEDKKEHGASGGVATVLREIVEKRETLEALATDPNVQLASDIRAAYYDDGVKRDLADSVNPKSWLRLAAAAREFIAAEQVAPKPRVFVKGDAEPEDRDTLVLVGKLPERRWDHEAGEIRIEFGHKPGERDSGRARQWWQVTGSRPTFGSWATWLRLAGPLTEVLPETPKEPRTFNKGDVIPDGVQEVMLADGDKLTRRENGLFSYTLSLGYLPGDTGQVGPQGESWYDRDFPLTEVLPGAPEEPRTFGRGDLIPADVKVLRADDGGEDLTRDESGRWRFGTTYTPGWATDDNLTTQLNRSALPLTEVLA
ncbi:hypothetical protein CH253_08345 [Rhodococcus sp. 06-156-3C]|uniref:hypothetical protein n=1 Tax=Rhodococcus sp. 06-156-3C TaxID=2022486 RepID=UPI000B9C5560|nr:hypothetical protein [Rhodococcus sp. 06-156-3C]OZD23856.1 hypothetical protein CH253_08345 [Rhodococcus sp. 06-156-3C]